jgi:hypothetical protein
MKTLNEITGKIKWKKVSVGHKRKPGGGSTEVFDWVSSDERFKIGRAADTGGYGGRGKAAPLVWKIVDKDDKLRKAYLRSYDTVASAKQAAEKLV